MTFAANLASFVGASNLTSTGALSGPLTSAVHNSATTLSLQTGGVTAVTVDANQNLSTANTINVPNTFGFKNRIINGSFQIWQRGTSFTDSSVNNYYVDRWRSEGYSVSGSVVISQQTFTAGQTAVPGFPQYYVQIATGGAIASGQYWAFQQRIEAPQNLSGYETVTLSFWARVPSGTLAAGTFTYGVGATAASNPALSTTWQKITITQSLSYGYGNGYVPVYVVNLPAGTAATTVQIANVQVEIGNTATSFDYRPYGTELALCQRYYQKSYDLSVAPGTVLPSGDSSLAQFCWGASNVGSVAGTIIPFPVQMRTAPTVTTYDGAGASGKVNTLNAGAGVTTGASTNTVIANPQKYWLRMYNNSVYGVEWAWTASAEL